MIELPTNSAPGQSLNSVVSVYADGGIIDRNPSSVGGTWAFVFVDATATQVFSASGHVAAAEVTPLGPEWVSNNFTEVLALLLAFEQLPDGWTGSAYSDSKNAISAHSRAAWNPPVKPDYLPDAIWGRMVAARERLGPVKFTLLGGHPTEAELAAGCRRDGKPVSDHNVWCDKAATAAGREYLRSIGQLPEKKPRAAKPKADVVSRADVLELIRAASTPLAGFDRADRSEFASFNMGRLQQHLIQQVQEMKGGKR